MIYPSRYLMNLLWVAKLFMSLIAKFLHASLPFLASEPKSNSAWQNTHTCTYLTQSHWNLHVCTHAHTQTHTHTCACTMISIYVRLYTNPYFMRGEASVFTETGSALVKTKDQHRNEPGSHYLSMPGSLLWVISISPKEKEVDLELLCLL